jgi:hypothetical protein
MAPRRPAGAQHANCASIWRFTRSIRAFDTDSGPGDDEYLVAQALPAWPLHNPRSRGECSFAAY